MGKSVGFMMFCGGIAGAVICFVLLVATGVIFVKQRKKLLDELQKD